MNASISLYVFSDACWSTDMERISRFKPILTAFSHYDSYSVRLLTIFVASHFRIIALTYIITIPKQEEGGPKSVIGFYSHIHSNARG